MSQAHARTARRSAVAVITAFLVALGVSTSSALAADSYSYGGNFSVGTNPVIQPIGSCNIHEMDVDAQENVYVLCGGVDDINGTGGTVLKKYDKNGNPVPFTASQPYIVGNQIIENPDPNYSGGGQFGKTFSGRSKLAVDRSSSGSAGYIYVTIEQSVEIYDPTGKWVASLQVPAAFGMQAIATDINGNLYVNSQFKVNKYDPSWTMIAQLFASETNNEFTIIIGDDSIAIDSTGAVWGVGHQLDEPAFGTNSVVRYEADQFTAPEIESTFALGTHKKAKLSPFGSWPLEPFGSATPLAGQNLDVDLDDDSLFVTKQAAPSGILHFSRGTAEEPSHQLSPTFGDATNVGGPNEFPESSDGLALGPVSKILYVAKGNTVSKFVPGGPVPTVRTHAAEIPDIGHSSAVVRAGIELAGGGPITGCEVKFGLTKAYGSTAPCTPDPNGAGADLTEDTEVSATLAGLSQGSTYHYAFVATNANGTGYGMNQTVRSVAVLNVQTGAVSEVDAGSATLNGSLDPDGMSTDYYFEYGLAGELTLSTPVGTPLTGSGVQPVSAPIDELKPGALYSYRLVGKNVLGTTLGPVKTFRAAGPPSVSGVRATNVVETAADLNAKINPGGYPTTYRFEYGPTLEYGSSIPIPPAEEDAGEGNASNPFSLHVEGLEPGRPYHFRVVATNKWGSTTSADTSFNFFPQPCPNEHVRQVTLSSYLPDCRAYELVSPEDAGGIQIYPGSETDDFGFAFGFATPLQYHYVIQNTGLAQSPSRFMFFAGLGSVDDTTNSMLESYVSTRTNNGWKTTFPGLKGSEGGETGHKVCSVGLDFCLDHKTELFSGSENPLNTGYVFSSEDGDKVATVPSNINSIPGGDEWVGDWQTSPNFDHFVFSSKNVPFAPGGITAAPGSAYDNDLGDQSVSLISLLPNGEPIASDSVNANEFILFAPNSISTDGSHILMQTTASTGPNHLYMRVNDAVTYDIANGAGVSLIGMTRDGETVLFTATQQLAAEDHDESADVYRWDENGGAPTLTVVSQGNGQGDTDACNSSWAGNCSVVLLDTDRDEKSGFGPAAYKNVLVPGTDTKYGAESGAVVFYSPENLEGTAPLNGKNLYLARGGEVQYITTFGSNERVDRIQVSPDGGHVGFTTKAQLTTYDNDGLREMYTYDAETKELACASCIPSGELPTTDVEASMNGPFMSDDGRVFFATSDALVPTDVDFFKLPDVYEYVEGRPQLISSGFATNAKAPGGAALFVAKTLGLEAVSANGADVYFSTTDTLVPQDENGRFAKIYNARTNGGFPPPEEPEPCVAADECHGPGAATPEPLQIGTGSHVTGGNLTPEAEKKKKAGKSKGRCAKKKRAKRGAKRTCSGKGRKNR
jgi:hypothetical protein